MQITNGDGKHHDNCNTVLFSPYCNCPVCYCRKTKRHRATETKKTALPKPEIPGISTEKQKETDQKELDERPTFDFSLPGDNRTQSLALFFERPFKFNNIEGKLSGNYFTTFKKEEIPPEESVWGLYRKVSPDGSFSPDHTPLGLKGVLQGNGI